VKERSVGGFIQRSIGQKGTGPKRGVKEVGKGKSKTNNHMVGIIGGTGVEKRGGGGKKNHI